MHTCASRLEILRGSAHGMIRSRTPVEGQRTRNVGSSYVRCDRRQKNASIGSLRRLQPSCTAKEPHFRADRLRHGSHFPVPTLVGEYPVCICSALCHVIFACRKAQSGGSTDAKRLAASCGESADTTDLAHRFFIATCYVTFSTARWRSLSVLFTAQASLDRPPHHVLCFSPQSIDPR